jgi:glutamine cyclotransferase
LKNANPVSCRGGVLFAALLVLAGCRNAGQPPSIPPIAEPAKPGAAGVAHFGFEVVRTWPHDRNAFTQGLVFRRDTLLEGTGLNGQSALRELELKTGRVLKQVALPAAYFGEGIAVHGDEVFQLTWQNRRGFVYDVDTFQQKRDFTYEAEGWGITSDGTSLIMSGGTSRLRFVDPATFAERRTIEVTLDGRPVEKLNELEYIRGEVFANVWGSDDVMRIDPATGNVRGVVDFSGLLPVSERRPDTDVLNGIAYDPIGDRLFVTGKRWPAVFEVRLKARP